MKNLISALSAKFSATFGGVTTSDGEKILAEIHQIEAKDKADKLAAAKLASEQEKLARNLAAAKTSAKATRLALLKEQQRAEKAKSKVELEIESYGDFLSELDDISLEAPEPTSAPTVAKKAASIPTGTKKSAKTAASKLTQTLPVEEEDPAEGYAPTDDEEEEEVTTATTAATVTKGKGVGTAAKIPAKGSRRKTTK